MLRLGVDLGGTKIEVALVDVRGDDVDVILRRRVPTLRDEGYEAVLARVESIVRGVANEADQNLVAVPVGVGMPGGIERATGLVKNSNTTCLNGQPFRQDLSRRLGVDVVFDNDANCFALAEARLGAARGVEGIVFGVIMGTGVGGGLVIDGRVWGGKHGIAGEWGHHAVFARDPDAPPCYCGERGCLEAYASGPALERRYFTLSGEARALSEIAQRVETDAHAASTMETLVDAFGRGLANVIDIVDPSAIVLGGGLSNLELLYTEGRDRVARYVFNDELVTPLWKNTLGDSAGVLGAALLPPMR